MKTDERPKSCVNTMQFLKLRPMSCAVAAGVTSKAVTSNVPITWTIETTIAATAALNHRPTQRVGMPWTRAATASIVVARSASYRK